MERLPCDSFYYNEMKILNFETFFSIELSGVEVARVAFNEKWEQISGEPLGDDLVSAIGDRIEDHYE